MKKELLFMTLEYTNDDIKYIDDLISFLEEETNKIVDFFKIKDFKDKTIVKIYDNLEEFEEKYKEVSHEKQMPIWVSGFTEENNIFILSLKQQNKINPYKNNTLDGIKKLVCHEFVHTCHLKICEIRNQPLWTKEGIATLLVHDSYNEDTFNGTLEEMINKYCKYDEYYLMMKYTYDTYGYDYVFKLLSDASFALNETPKIYNEVYSLYNKKL